MKSTRRNVHFGFVMFVDFLGYTAKVEQVKTRHEFDKLAEDVSFIHEAFNYKTTNEHSRAINSIYQKTILTFSDCLVMATPIHSAHGVLNNGELHNKSPQIPDKEQLYLMELHSCGISQGKCAINGVFIRGGLTYGLWFRNRDTLISPGLINAYRLEQVASVPMIATTEEIVTWAAQFTPDDMDFFGMPDSLFLKHDLLPNGTSHWFLDYITISLYDTQFGFRDKEETPERKATLWAQKHAQMIAQAHAAAQIESVREKYVWLSRYHNEAVWRYFGSKTESLRVLAELV